MGQFEGYLQIEIAYSISIFCQFRPLQVIFPSTRQLTFDSKPRWLYLVCVVSGYRIHIMLVMVDPWPDVACTKKPKYPVIWNCNRRTVWSEWPMIQNWNGYTGALKWLSYFHKSNIEMNNWTNKILLTNTLVKEVQATWTWTNKTCKNYLSPQGVDKQPSRLWWCVTPP